MKKRIISIILVFSMLMSLMTITSFADGAEIIDSGTCGDGVTWFLDNNGCLTISGNGNITSYPFRQMHSAEIYSLVIEDGVTQICDSAFYNCTKLSSVELPGTLNYIGELAFSNCTSLRSIYIPCSVGNGAFSDCTALTSLTVGNQASFLGRNVERHSQGWSNYREKGAFAGCVSLKNVELGDGLTIIGSRCFESCSNIETVTIPNSVTTIGQTAFSGCKKLAEVVFLPDSSCKGIDYYAFAQCTSLKSFQFPEGVTKISAFVLSGCTALERVELHDGVTEIGYNGPVSQSSYTSVVYQGGSFLGCTALKYLRIPESVNRISPAESYSQQITSFSCSALWANSTILRVKEDSYAESYAKSTSHPYIYYFDTDQLFLNLYDPDGDLVTEGYEVAWYEKGNDEILTLGRTLSTYNENKTYEYEIRFTGDLVYRYETPKRQIANVKIAENNTTSFTLAELKQKNIQGRIVDTEGNGIAGATVSFSQKFGRNVKSTSVITDSDGYYCAELRDAETEICVSAIGFSTADGIYLNPDINEHDTIQLEQLPQECVSLDLSVTVASTLDSPTSNYKLSSFGGLYFTVHNDTRGENVTSFEAQYPNIYFPSDAVNEGDILTITVADSSGKMSSVGTTAVFSPSDSSAVQINLVENGYFSATLGDECTVLVFDDDGELLVESFGNGSFRCDPLPGGIYQAVFVQSTGLTKGISRISRFGEMGFKAGNDYEIRQVQICAGLISDLGHITIPSLNASENTYTVASGTSCIAKKSTVPVGGLVAVRAEYEVDPEYSSEEETVILDFPSSLSLIPGSLTVNGTNVNYNTFGNTLEIPIGQKKGVVQFYVSAAVAGSYALTAYLRFHQEESVVLETIGAASFTATEQSLDALPVTGQVTTVVKGQTYANSKVKLYDNNVLVASTTANSNGAWAVGFDLLNPEAYSVHTLYAEMVSPYGVKYYTSAHELIYESSQADLQKIVLSPYTTIDLSSSSTKPNTYSVDPNKVQDFTIKLQFSNDNVKNASVTLDTSIGIKTLPCEYDPASGFYFCKFSGGLINGISVAYDQKGNGHHCSISGTITAVEQNQLPDIPDQPPDTCDLPDEGMTLRISSVTPNNISSGIVTICLKGTLFEPNAEVSLKNGSKSYDAQQIWWINHETLYARFDLTSATNGDYTVSVSCGDNRIERINAVTLNKTLPKGMTAIELHAGQALQQGKVYQGFVTVANHGYTDSDAPLLMLSGTNSRLRLNEGDDWSEAITVFAQNKEGLAGTLGANQTAYVPFYYMVEGTGDFHLDVLNLSQTYEVIPSDSASAESSEESFARLMSRMGDTYSAFSANAADIADAITGTMEDISLEIILAACQQELRGFGTEAGMLSTVDLSGQTLSLSRTWYSDTKAGIFGKGWHSPYELTAIYAEEAGEAAISVYSFDSVEIYVREQDGVFRNILSESETAMRDASERITVTRRSGEKLIFNADGTLAYDEDVFGNALELSYTGGILTTVTASSGDGIQMEIKNGRVISAVVANGDQVTYGYQGDLLVSAVTKYGTTVYDYDSEGRLTRVTNPDGTYISYTFDKYGRIVHAANDELSLNYDYAPLETTVQDSMGNYSRTRYDLYGNAVWVVDGMGKVSYAQYDENLHLSNVSDGLLSRIEYSYDETGLPVCVALPDGSSVDYTYDAFGNITSITDAKGQTTAYMRDANGSAVGVCYEDGNTETYTYDAKGRVASSTSRSGVTATYTYNDAGNIIRIDYSTGEGVSYTYNAHGSVTNITQNGETTTLTYTEKNELSSVRYPDGRSITYAYDDFGRRVSVADDKGYKTGYLYNEQGLLSAVTDGNNVLLNYFWNPDGTLQEQHNANGTGTKYSYEAGRVTSIENYDADARTISFFYYTYDDLGLITEIRDNSGIWCYQYDALGQLAWVETPDGVITKYCYDVAGNRTAVIVDGNTISYSANALNQYTAFGETYRTYDPDGNLLSETRNDETAYYLWDVFGRLVRYTDFYGNVYDYGYDAFGLRNSVTVNGETTTYLNDPTGYGYAVASYGADVETHYTLANGIVVSRTGGNTYYYNANHLGSVTEITGDDGSVVNRYTYDQEGNVLTSTENIVNPYTYVGIYGIVNDGNGLIYDRARYVSAETDSFISVDPAGQTYDLNVYRLHNNNAMNYSDITVESSTRAASRAAINDISSTLSLVSASFKRYGQHLRKSGMDMYKGPIINSSGSVQRALSREAKTLLNESTSAIKFSKATGRIGNILSIGSMAYQIKEEGFTASSMLGIGDFFISNLASKNIYALFYYEVGLKRVSWPIGVYLSNKFPDNIFKNAAEWITTKSHELHNNISNSTPNFSFSITPVIFSPIIDPSGYVYAGVTDNRLEGVTATIYYEDYPLDEFGEPDYDAGLQAIEWSQAGDYDEVNPQKTDSLGRYGWEVPEGKWCVKFTKPGYEDYWTDWMTVPPEYTDVNINLVSKASPMVTGLNAYRDGVQIIFSQYMDATTVTSDKVTITVGGKKVEGTISPLNAGQNYEETMTCASIFEFSPAETLSGVIKVGVSGCQSYCGTNVTKYSGEAIISERPLRLRLYTSGSLAMDGSETVFIDVFPRCAGMYQNIVLESSVPERADLDASKISLDENGHGEVHISGHLPGDVTISAKMMNSILSDTCLITVLMPEESSSEDICLIYFDANGGGGTMTDMSLTKGTSILLPECTFNAPDWVEFSGWEVEELLLKPGDSYVFVESTSVKAVWSELADINVSFDSNQGAGTMNSFILKEGTEYTLPECSFTPPQNSVFTGWSIDNAFYYPGEVVILTHDVSITAIWGDFAIIVSNDGSIIRYTIVTDKPQSVVVFIAWYDENGKYLGVVEEQIELERKETNVVTNIPDSAYMYKVFLLDLETLSPLCRSRNSVL